MAGKLYICATPIGNLEDITFRVLRILKEVDFIAAEDTRHTIKLLNYFEIKKKMVSYHEHNEKVRSIEIIDRILNGENCALVSDAGMPGISDPGEVLIKEAIANNIEVNVLPGATASIAALVMSGLATDKFVFEGFLPHKKNDKNKELEKLINEKRTIIFYESPHRIKETLKCMINILGDRKISISREITKKFEETIRGTLSVCIEIFDTKEIKGEFVIIVEGSQKDDKIELEIIDIERILIQYINEGHTKKDAIKMAVKEYNLNKNEVYQKSLEI